MNKYQYDEIAEQYSNMFNTTKQYVLIPTFKKIIGDVSGKSVLDLACGDGLFTRILGEYKPSEILGVDISKKLLKKAIETENQNPLNISYKIEDVLTLRLSKTYELITAVYLLNYAQTTNELEIMCKNIYEHLSENGQFFAITINSNIKPMNNFYYERKYSNVTGREFFEDGDQIKIEMREKGKPRFEFISFYWSKETYERYLKIAGFKSIKWVDSIISQEGISKLGSKYWKNYSTNPTIIGLICEK